MPWDSTRWVEAPSQARLPLAPLCCPTIRALRRERFQAAFCRASRRNRRCGARGGYCRDIEYIQPQEIDEHGMTWALRTANLRAIAAIEEQLSAKGTSLDVILLDGNAQHLDAREVNIVKGDGKCASIAAASIIAKVDRDALMCRYAEQFPHYGFESNKGYASAEHIEAIKQHGLSPVHRASFCRAWTQEALF